MFYGTAIFKKEIWYWINVTFEKKSILFINNKISKLFDGSFQLLGYTFLLAFFLLALNEKWVACGINLIPALYILFTSTGVELDTNAQNYRKYYSHFSLNALKKQDNVCLFEVSET